MARVFEDVSRDGYGVLDPAQGPYGADVEGIAVHDHGVEGGLAALRGRAAVAYCAVALVGFAGGAADLDGVQDGAGVGEGVVCGVGGDGEGAAPGVDDDWGRGACCEGGEEEEEEESIVHGVFMILRVQDPMLAVVNVMEVCKVGVGDGRLGPGVGVEADETR